MKRFFSASSAAADREIAMSAHNANNWLSRIWASVAEQGRRFAPIPARDIEPLDRAKLLARSLLSERGEASGAAVARELLAVLNGLPERQRHFFLNFLAEGFQADPERLASACRTFLEAPTPEMASRLSSAAEPPRQELLRRMNMAEGGTAALVKLREAIPEISGAFPALVALDSDLRHLLTSWFNRGFLELRQIDWQTPASILEKLIAYEAVHEIQGWDDLRRRLGPDRRCFAFFHPALPGEPLIFVEVALVRGLAGSVQSLLERETDEQAQRERAKAADTAIFYSISNCQAGLRGISFGNFLIKQVVEILRAEMPGLKTFATLSPMPGFRHWLESRLVTGKAEIPIAADEAKTILSATKVGDEAFNSEALRRILEKASAVYLTSSPQSLKREADPVSRFHLGNGASLERIIWMGNPSPRGLRESWGIMVNYLYDPALIETNHEGYVRNGQVARSAAVDRLLAPAAWCKRRKT